MDYTNNTSTWGSCLWGLTADEAGNVRICDTTSAAEVGFLTPEPQYASTGEADLYALIDATYGVPQTAPGLLAWIEHACEWELNRREGRDFPLRPREAAIDPSEDAVTIYAAIAMRATFAQDAPAVRALFDALVNALTGAGRKQ